MKAARKQTYLTLSPGDADDVGRVRHVFRTRRLPEGQEVRIVDAQTHQGALDAVKRARHVGERGERSNGPGKRT